MKSEKRYDICHGRCVIPAEQIRRIVNGCTVLEGNQLPVHIASFENGIDAFNDFKSYRSRVKLQQKENRGIFSFGKRNSEYVIDEFFLVETVYMGDEIVREDKILQFAPVEKMNRLFRLDLFAEKSDLLDRIQAEKNQSVDMLEKYEGSSRSLSDAETKRFREEFTENRLKIANLKIRFFTDTKPDPVRVNPYDPAEYVVDTLIAYKYVPNDFSDEQLIVMYRLAEKNIPIDTLINPAMSIDEMEVFQKSMEEAKKNGVFDDYAYAACGYDPAVISI